MNAVLSYEGTHNEMRSTQPVEIRNPYSYSEDKNLWLESTNQDVGVLSGSPYGTEVQEEGENACLFSCCWKCSI